jgi:hypothetical protein
MTRLALRCIRRIATFRSLTVQSGHWPELALDASVVNDPKRTLAKTQVDLIDWVVVQFGFQDYLSFDV